MHMRMHTNTHIQTHVRTYLHVHARPPKHPHTRIHKNRIRQHKRLTKCWKQPQRRTRVMPTSPGNSALFWKRHRFRRCSVPYRARLQHGTRWSIDAKAQDEACMLKHKMKQLKHRKTCSTPCKGSFQKRALFSACVLFSETDMCDVCLAVFCLTHSSLWLYVSSLDGSWLNVLSLNGSSFKVTSLNGSTLDVWEIRVTHCVRFSCNSMCDAIGLVVLYRALSLNVREILVAPSSCHNVWEIRVTWCVRSSCHTICDPLRLGVL